MKNVEDFNDLAALLRDFETRLERQERHTHIFPVQTITVVVPEPEPEPPVAVCQVLVDDFERTTLGADWTDGPIFDKSGTDPTLIENGITTGAYTAGENDAPPPTAVIGSVRTTAAYPDIQAQFAELVIGDMFQGHDPSMPEYFQWMEGNWYLFTQVTDTPGHNASVGCYVVIQAGASTTAQDGFCYMELFRVNDDGTSDYPGTYSGEIRPLPDWRSNPDWTIRLETDPDGHCKAYFGGMLVVEGDVLPTGGTHVGFGSQWGRTSYASTVPNNATAARAESFVGGCLAEPFTPCDDFERADGPLGPNWILSPGSWSATPVELVIEDGAATGADTGGSTFAASAWATPFPVGATQVIEVLVERVLTTSVNGEPNGVVSLLTNMTVGSRGAQAVDFDWGQGEDLIVVDLYRYNPAGSWDYCGDSVAWSHPDVEPVLLRLESEPDGTQRIYIDDVLVTTCVDSAPIVGQLVGIDLWQRPTRAPARILRACVGPPLGSETATRRRPALLSLIHRTRHE